MTTRLVHASSLIANLDTAHSFVNLYGDVLGEYPTGPVTAFDHLPSQPMRPCLSRPGYLVGPSTVTVDGISFTVISSGLGVEVDA